ncbi:transporter substrate-binding domain-containing protein [Psychromonas ossibalaenae]|uniref:transporter substrate-binding domain-containing protein n=1 Tax=Psychromonas ossibalaenae TaxID=444922 RepID=UPI00037858D8|nr:transporter substrate-binding domain-containing protein [Psychromonas ossibalaenae]
MNILSAKIQLLGFFLCCIFIIGCTHNVQADNEVFKRITEKGVLVVGMSGEQPPYNFVTSKGGIIGFDVGLAEELANSLGVKMEIALMPFPELLNALQENKVDVIISAFSISEQRRQKVSFVGPYAQVGKSLLTTKKTLARIRNSTGFNHAQVNLTALENSTSVTLAQERLEKANLTTVIHYEDAVLAVLSGQADALIADLSICDLLLIRDNSTELTKLNEPLAVEEIGIALNKNEPLLENKLTEKLQQLQKSGELQKHHQKWFNNGGWLNLLPY